MELLDYIEAYYSPAKRTDAEAKRSSAPPPHLDFELPDWSGQVQRRTPVAAEALIQRSEELLPLHNRQPGSAVKRLRNKCSVEFVMG
ncbi:MAG: hypothetical protein ABMA26_15785 [Limisphaerales bacterium]